MTSCGSYTYEECLEYFEGDPYEIEDLDVDMEVCAECYEELKEKQENIMDNW